MPQVRVQELAAGIEPAANGLKRVPLRIELGEVLGTERVELAPVWAALVLPKDRLDDREELAIVDPGYWWIEIEALARP